MNRKEMEKKYNPTLLKMYNQTGYDTGVCFDKLIYENDVRNGREKREDTYAEIPADFDFDEFEIDYQKMIAQ